MSNKTYVEYLEEALKAYEDARESLFEQCLSNPIYNSWNKQVDLTKLNKAHELAGRLVRNMK